MLLHQKIPKASLLHLIYRDQDISLIGNNQEILSETCRDNWAIQKGPLNQVYKIENPPT